MTQSPALPASAPGCRRCAYAFLFALIFVAILHPPSSLATPAPNAPSDLICELLEHPEETVITSPTPDLGWIYNPSFRNDSQAASRIIVASSPALAAAGTGDMWDSGLVNSSASLNVTYAGAALQTNTDYYWCVQTVDSAGQTSPFSVVQHFHMDTHLAAPPILPVTTNGLVWIWYPESPAALNVTRYFQKTFVVPSSLGVAGAQMLLTADDQFTLYLNGSLVGGGNNWKQFTLLSLGSLIHVGTNTIGITVSNLQNNAGLTGRLDYRGSDGSTNTVFIDGTWQCNSNLVANWNQPGFDASSWSNALVLGNYGVAPWNTTAALPLTGLVYNSSTNLWANRYPLRFSTASPVSVVNTAPGRWFIDFGQDAFGSVTVHANGAFAGTNVQVRFGEMAIGNTVNTAPSGTVRYGVSSFTLQNGNVTYPVQPPVNSGQTISPPAATFGVVFPFRYLELTNFPGTLTVTDITQQRLQSEFNTNAASFTSSSPALNQVWNLCHNSMQVLTFNGIYVDGDRERKPYEADAYIQQLGEFAVDREYTMSRYSFEYLLTHPTWPTEWKFYMIELAWNDYQATGNPDLLYRYYDTLKPDTFSWAATGNGLMRGFPGFAQTTNSDIVDWPANDRDGFTGISATGYRNWTNAVNNAFYYHTLQVMANIAAVIGRTNDIAGYNALSTQLYGVYNTTFWNGSSYIDGVGTTHSSAHANFFPLAFGLVPAGNQAAVVNYLHTRIAANGGMPASVYGAQFLLDGLFQFGDDDTALGLMTTNGTRGWLNMINIGSTLTTEAWSFSDKSNEDWNHAWGSAAGNLIARFILGLQAATAGGGQVIIHPHLGKTISYVQGVLPTIRGPVGITASNGSGQFQMLVTIPGNVTATVMLPTLGVANAVALVDGEQVSATVSNNCLVVTNLGSGQHAVWLSTNSAVTQTALYNNWAAAWFGANPANPSLSAPNADPDGDGLNNLNEFIAGTNPQDPTDRFHIASSSYTATGPVMNVTVTGAAGRHYTLQHSLTLNPTAWTTADTQTAVTDNQPLTLYDSGLSGSTQAFLRVMVTYP